MGHEGTGAGNSIVLGDGEPSSLYRAGWQPYWECISNGGR
jgi:hypothetical protein